MFNKFIAVIVAFFYLATSAGAATINFEYDQAGNMVSGQGKYYEYNAANQLVKVRKDAPSGPVIAEYVYDYQGQRVKKIENGITTYYIGKHYEERKGNTVNEKTNYIFVNGQRAAARIVKDNEPAKVSYYLNNHLGSADAVTDAQGNVTERLRYYPYGEYRTQPNPKERHAYTGKERDEATDEYYYEARYYNPGIRRFTQADTVTPNLYDPQSLNRYAYTRNNPVKYVDPSGHIFDVVLDVLFIANDIKTLITDPSSRTLVNYVALGADIIGAVVPGATGLGAGVKTAAGIGAGVAIAANIEKGKDAFRFVKKIYNKFDNIDSYADDALGKINFQRWKRGDAIDKALPDGTNPSWNTVKQRYWKNRYELTKKTGEFDEVNIDRMKRGLAPQDYNDRTSKFESRELHHVDPQRNGGANNPINIREVTPDQHAKIDSYRHVR